MSADKKQRLKVYLTQSELFAEEQVVFSAETYNQLFEPIFNQKISLELIRQDGKKFLYSFYNNPSNKNFYYQSTAGRHLQLQSLFPNKWKN